jgi:hypothetical protein
LRRGMPRLSSLVLVVMLAIVAAGCGSTKPPTTAEWADSICSSVNTWTDSIKSAVDPLKSGDISQDSVQTAGDDLKSATDTLASDLDGLDKPDSQVGQQAQDSVDKLSSDLNEGADSIKATADGVSGPSDVPSAATAVRTTLGTMKSDITATVKSLEQLDAKGELQTAFQQSTACDQLSGSA